MSDSDKKWVTKEFGIPEEDVLWYNSGSCYDRIGVVTKESADKVSAKVREGTVNGGMYHGMPLGWANSLQKGIWA